MLLGAVVLYLALTVGMGVFSMRYIRGSNDFVNAGRRLPLFLSSAALFALWFGSETLFGATSAFIDGGILGIIEDPLGGFLCLMLFGAFFAKRLYRMNLLTLGDLYRQAYGKPIELLASAFMLLTFFGYIAAQLVALGLLLQLLAGISLSQGILISTLVVTLYTLAGGMWAISITDFVQSIIIVGGLLWACMELVGRAGGINAVIAAAPVGHFEAIPPPTTHAWLHYLAAWMTLGLGSLPSQDIFQRMNASKNEKVAVRSFYLGGMLYLAIAVMPLLIVLAAQQLYPELLTGDMQQVLPRVMLNQMPMGIQVVFFGALLSAIFSTCSGAILAPASILSENIIKPLWGKKLTDKQFLVLLRLSVIAMAVAGCLMAMQRRNIYELVGEASLLGLVTLLTPMSVAVFWPRYALPAAAAVSMVAGLLAWCITEYLISVEIPPLLWGTTASVTTYVLAVLLHKKRKPADH
jgi:Na+/proline symporter